MKLFNVLLGSLVTIVLIIGSSCSESDREIKSEQLQERGDRLYYAVNEEKPYTGKVVELNGGQKHTERTFKNGKLHGLSTRWDSDGQKKSEVGYQNGEQTGPYRTWYDNGQQEKEGYYKDGKEDGQWVYWYTNGQKERECSYKDGVLDGRWISWYDNGQQEKEGYYKDGKEDGQWGFWYSNGQKQKEGEYKDGKEDGQWVFCYKNGQKQEEGAYKDGKRQVGLNFWTKDGEKRETGTVTDIDGNTYLTVKIGEQWWMVENLRVTHYRNGDAIPHVTDDNGWSERNTGAYCSDDNDMDNAETYGYLYNWHAVNDPRGLAPEGWHVPSDKEWKQLEMYLGMSQSEANDTGWRGAGVGSKLKEIGTAHWIATNESGFSAFPGGYRTDDGDFYHIGHQANFWSSTEYTRSTAWSRGVSSSSSGAFRDDYYKRYGYSVRCVRD